MKNVQLGENHVRLLKKILKSHIEFLEFSFPIPHRPPEATIDIEDLKQLRREIIKK